MEVTNNRRRKYLECIETSTTMASGTKRTPLLCKKAANQGGGGERETPRKREAADSHTRRNATTVTAEQPQASKGTQLE